MTTAEPPAGGVGPNPETSTAGPRPAAADAGRRPHPSQALAGIPGWMMRMGVSAWLLIGVIALVGALYLGLAQINALVSPLVVAVVMGMLLYPLVDRMESKGLRRALGAAILLAAVALIVLASILLSVRGIFDRGPEIAQQLSQGWTRIADWLDGLGFDVSSLQASAGSLGSGSGGLFGRLLTATVSSVGFFLVGLFIGTFILYYLLKDWHILEAWVGRNLGVPASLGGGLIKDATTSIRLYFYAITLTSIPVALIIGLVMWLLGLPLAFTIVLTMHLLGLPLGFTIALVTFVTSYIPYLGAILSGAFATLVALGSGGLVQAAIVLIVVLLTQNVMQTVMLTRLSSTQLNIHPIANLASTIVGASLFGIIGATLSAPVLAAVLTGKARISAHYRDLPVDPPAAPVDPPEEGRAVGGGSGGGAVSP